MKSELKTIEVKKTEEEIKFPVLMQYKTENFVVLFTSAQNGTVVQSDDSVHYYLGYHSDTWSRVDDTKEWTKLPNDSSVVLSNE